MPFVPNHIRGLLAILAQNEKLPPNIATIPVRSYTRGDDDIAREIIDHARQLMDEGYIEASFSLGNDIQLRRVAPQARRLLKIIEDGQAWFYVEKELPESISDMIVAAEKYANGEIDTSPPRSARRGQTIKWNVVADELKKAAVSESVRSDETEGQERFNHAANSDLLMALSNALLAGLKK